MKNVSRIILPASAFTPYAFTGDQYSERLSQTVSQQCIERFSRCIAGG